MSTPGIFIAVNPTDEQISQLDRAMQQWTLKAASMECSWICADCSMTFPEGMPDKCEHGHQGCTDIITRDKEASKREDSK